MTTNYVFPLLELPAGVESVLLPFVASGTGGLQALLNLRQVCSTTKSWVDTLPPRQSNPLFSKAQVRMDSDVDTIERFFESPPSSAVSALSLSIKAIVDTNPPAEEEELWDRFCTFWAPRLKTLELRKESGHYFNRIFDDNRKIVNLLEAPNLQILRVGGILVPLNSTTLFPSSLYKVNELSLKCYFFEYNGVRKRFYAELKKNPNLRKLETVIHDIDELEYLQNLIDAKKKDAQMEVNLDLKCVFPDNRDEWDDDDNEDDAKYLEFAKSVVASKSTIRLQMSKSHNLENTLAFLPLHIGVEILEKVESVEMWVPKANTLSLLENLPRLKQVTVRTDSLSVVLLERRLNELTFPPSLEKLGFTKGFPARAALPEALKSLTLGDFFCNVTELGDSLALLKTQCAGLETLNITWDCKSTKKPADDVEKTFRFANLRSLTFQCHLYKKDVKTCRTVLLRGFLVETLQLHHLALRFRWNGQKDRDLPVLNAPFFSGLCKGPVSDSLLMCDVEKNSVTPGGFPLLERLTSLAAANAKSREEREGRGQWQREWKIIE